MLAFLSTMRAITKHHYCSANSAESRCKAGDERTTALSSNHRCISHLCKEFQQGLSLFALNMQQRVMCANRGNHVYSNINNEYTAAPLPHTGSSNHLTLLMNTVYTPRVRKEPPVVVDVVVWAQEAIPMLWAAWSAHHGAFSDNIWGLCGHRGIYWGCDVRLSNQDCLAVNVLYYNLTEFDSVLLAEFLIILISHAEYEDVFGSLENLPSEVLCTDVSFSVNQRYPSN